MVNYSKRFWAIIYISFGLVFLATQSIALSCMRPDPVSTFNRLADVPDPYVILYGRLDFDASKLPEGVENRQREPEPIPGQFVGQGLFNDGFTVDVDRAITIQPLCAGPWCGQIAPETTYLLFARVEGPNLVFDVDACGSSAFPDPNKTMLDQMTVCINGGPCKRAH